MNLAITICATKGYTEAMLTQARRVVRQQDLPQVGSIIISGDDSKEVKEVIAFYKNLLPSWNVRHIVSVTGDGGKNYQVPAQLTIARMREAAFQEAIKLQATHVWSLDSDVLPPAECLAHLIWGLSMPNNFYEVSFAPYPSQGGGLHLGGFGTQNQQINSDYTEDERDLTPDLIAERQLLTELEDLAKKNPKYYEAIQEHVGLSDFKKRLESCPPKGNVFKANAEKWRRRGWFEMCYPAIGKGALVPIDWVGFGCTLLNQRALRLASFDGYEGRGTEDLYIGWHRWYPNGIRMCAIPHVSCDHIIRREGKYVHIHSFTQADGEYRDHLRTRETPWVNLK